MSNTTIGRRQLVRTAAGVAAGGVLVAGAGATSASASTSAHESDSHHSVLGGWWVEHNDDPPGPPNTGIAVVSIGAGGIIISNDIRPAGTDANGAWTMEEERFKATVWGVADLGPGVPPGSVRIRVRGRLHHDRLVGTFTATGYDAKGARLFSNTGTFTGTRLRP
ncbi:hypothetical protein ABEG17_14865 [Pedococcus sp. KACC 23699]|uniref:Twin-arginine translocation signal domain-containing protein n=1 Tax=Pedococcus sp. KACC 23699 TaxID=3149228 RepID=A0AAU7JRB8_9MICO